MNKKPRPSCKAKAMDLLSRSDQSIRRLTEKLRHREYSQEEIEETIAWLQEKHFIDEAAGCQRRFSFLYEDSTYSLRQIVAKLQQQGYEREMIDNCVPEDTGDREYRKAMKSLQIKFRPGADYKKMLQYLYTRGFAYDGARNAVEDLLWQWENAAEEQE